jgi:phenylacetic acid degradation operon negative regulatory protein
LTARMDRDGTWCVVITSELGNTVRDVLRKELVWLGFGTIAPGVMAHPMANRDSLMGTVRELGVQEGTIILRVRKDPWSSEQPAGRGHRRGHHPGPPAGGHRRDPHRNGATCATAW